MSIGTDTSPRSDAAKCRARGWTAGTRIVGDEGYGPTVIEITAVGERRILAKTISHNGKPCEHGGSEGSWMLSCRDWVEVSGTSPEPLVGAQGEIVGEAS